MLISYLFRRRCEKNLHVSHICTFPAMETTKQSFHKHFFLTKVVCSFKQVLLRYTGVAAQLRCLGITKCTCKNNPAIVLDL